jgi:cardiolipin synthase
MTSRSPSLHSLDLANQAFSRTAGAELILGNRVRLLRDAAENYPAWLQSIADARKWIHLETYIFYGDAVGKRFADLLCAKAKEGIRIRILYDWWGNVGRSSRGFWRPLEAAGIEIRRFNPPSFDSPFAWLNHRHRINLAAFTPSTI